MTKIKISEEEVVDVSRIYTLKAFAERMNVAVSSVYIWKLKGELQIIKISGSDFIVEPKGGLKRKKKGGK